MKSHPFKYLLLGVLSALAVDAGTQAQAFSYIKPSDAAWTKAFDFHIGFTYEELAFNDFPAYVDPVGNKALDEMRGGFVTSNGMVIDFTFAANTLVDGQLINQVVLNTAELASAAALRSVLQIGEENTAFKGAMDLDKLPNVLTVVQNNLDNITLQQLNVLDLTVQNMGNFVRQSITPEIEFQNSMGLAP